MAEVKNIDDLDPRKLRNSEILIDVFSILALISISIWLFIFVIAIFGKKDVILFVPYISYIVCISIFIYTSRKLYNDITTMLQKQCHETDYIIESRNRFYNAVSLIYYYTKAYIKTILNIIIAFLGVFILYMTVLNNLVYDDSFLSNYIHRQYAQNDLTVKIIIAIYFLLGLIALIYIYVIAMSSVSLYAFENDTLIGRLLNTGASRFIRLSNIIKIVLMIFFFPAIIYYLEQIANIWARIIKRRMYHIEGQDIHFIPVLETLHQNRLFQYLNLTDSTVAKKHAGIFIKGVVFCVLYALLILPRVNLAHLCSGISTSDSDRENTESKAKEYAGKFKFGFLFVIILTIFLHIGEFVFQTLKMLLGMSAHVAS